MKRLANGIVLFCLASCLLAQLEPRIRQDGEDFTYAALECLGPYSQIPQKLGELMAEVQKQNLEMLGEPSMIYYNSPAQVTPEELHWDVCVPLHALEKVAAPLKKGEYKYPVVAEVMHKGPYASVSSAYPALMEFIARSGYAVSGPICETYMDDPASTKPEECHTLIVVPVRK
ncbi:MAG TPA: GyrI-like domain-containing protein [Thermodesulfobacteriota bacterium]|nr:GyrI-like domain-containing protein [Thermodesulfobacteriota bacterium]